MVFYLSELFLSFFPIFLFLSFFFVLSFFLASGGLARTVELVAETFVNTHLLSVVCLRLFEVRTAR